MPSPTTPQTNPSKKIDVVICSGDFISGVTSWAFRLRKAFDKHPRFKISLLNCLNTTQTTGNFDAITPTPKAFKAHLKDLDNPIVIPNYFWDLFHSCRQLRNEGKALTLIGYCRSDSKAEYYDPLEKVADLLSHIFAVSSECKTKLKQSLPSHLQIPITVLPTGIEIPQTLDRSWQTAPLRIAFGGRIEQKQKRVNDLIPLLDELYRSKVDFTLSIAGAGRPMHALEEQLKKRDKESRVQIKGKLLPDEMPGFWREHDIMLSLSEYEGTSNSMLEAMAAGCVPIVSETKSGTRGIITPGENGFTFPIGDIERLAELIRNLYSLSQLSRSAQAKAKEFSMQKHASSFEHVLEKSIR